MADEGRSKTTAVQIGHSLYLSVITNQNMNLFVRGVVLFSIGVFLALVLNLLQIQRNVTLFPPDVIASIFSSAWWVPPCCGTASAVIGLLYPCIDSHLGEPHKFKREWSSVMRCVAVFVGINHASAKVDFANNMQLSLTLAALSIGLWWTFDRSRSGFGLGIGIAFLATLVTQLLVYNGVYQPTARKQTILDHESVPPNLYPINLHPQYVLNGGRKPEPLGKTHAETGRIYQLLTDNVGFEPWPRSLAL
ncbi:insulin-induced gene 2 protein isoform X1 [Narcine bancroftii]|uniref:insulin-induced gene 2 protein isoform X1 n=1 Tax=Narcine bancroftii TaxID=1343680 RepID=UPI003831541E